LKSNRESSSEAKAEKETGEKKIYMINVTAETEEMKRRMKLVKNTGNEYAMPTINDAMIRIR
jgi:ribulose-bisphosphate carboxylase large chain